MPKITRHGGPTIAEATSATPEQVQVEPRGPEQPPAVEPAPEPVAEPPAAIEEPVVEPVAEPTPGNTDSAPLDEATPVAKPAKKTTSRKTIGRG